MNNIKTFIKSSSDALTILLFLTVGFNTFAVSQEGLKNSNHKIGDDRLQLKYSDSVIKNRKRDIILYKQKKDTLNIINSLFELSEHYAHIVDYGNSYDGYWEALILADKSNDIYSKSRIYQALGWLYLFYRRDKEALKHFNLSIKLKKELIEQDKLHIAYLSSDYFALVNLHRTNNDILNATKYLDSCNNIQKIVNEKNYYIEAEAGYLNAYKKNYEKALSNLKNSEEHFKTNNPWYLVIINYLYAKVYYMMGDNSKSIDHYNKSLELTKLHQRHTNYTLMIHEALGDIYSKTENYEMAYLHSSKARILNEQTFGRKSKNNQYLFEIKDKHRLQKETEKTLLKEQRINNLENAKRVWSLKMILMGVVILSLLLYGTLLLKNLTRKHKLEKNVLEEKRKMELQKTNSILEVKNKELTTSALQLIEKEEFIEKLKGIMSKNNDSIDMRTINRMINNIQGSPGSNWKEFETRFTMINQSFYKKIKETFPNLGKTDLKICALVKLDFSSKDMASLLGISIESVHTSRHRLRKKLKLKRDDNLTDFISSF